VDKLSAQQLRCLALVAEAETNEQIAARLSLGPQTVKTHLHAVYSHLGVQDAGNPRVAAAVMWIAQGLGQEGRGA